MVTRIMFLNGRTVLVEERGQNPTDWQIYALLTCHLLLLKN